MGTISKNFSFKEFEASEVAQRLHINNTITDWDVRDNIVELVDNVLQPLRDAYGMPIYINSGYRSKQLNNEIGGVPTSQHCTGQAADCGCAYPLRLARLLVEMKLPFDQLILYPTFVHISYKADGENRMQVLYSDKYKGENV